MLRKKTYIIICVLTALSLCLSACSDSNTQLHNTDRRPKSDTSTVTDNITPTAEAITEKVVPTEETKPTEEAVPTPTMTDNEIMDTYCEVVMDKGMLDVSVNDIGDTEFHAIWPVRNKSEYNIELTNADFDLEDYDGHLLQAYNNVQSAPQIIKPGEIGYLYKNGMVDDGVPIDDVYLSAAYGLTINYEDDLIEYELQDLDLRAGLSDQYPKVIGRVVNNTDQDAKYIHLYFFFYNDKDKCIGITQKIITNVPAGQKQSFEHEEWYMSDKVSLSTIASYKVVAYNK